MHVKKSINSIYGTFDAKIIFTSLFSLQKGQIQGHIDAHCIQWK